MTLGPVAHRLGPAGFVAHRACAPARFSPLRLCSIAAAVRNWEEYHVPVLRDETVAWLVTDPAGIYADCTLGGGGHSAAILEAIAPAGGRLICADRDADALRQAGARLRSHVDSGAATLVQTTFGRFPSALARLAPTLRAGGGADEDGDRSADGLLSGLLLDLGVSSHQIDDAGRGFSFRFDGPLDMRMDQVTGQIYV